MQIKLYQPTRDFGFEDLRAIPFMIDAAFAAIGLRKTRDIQVSIEYSNDEHIEYRFHKSTCFASIYQRLSSESWKEEPIEKRARAFTQWMMDIAKYLSTNWPELKIDKVDEVFKTIVSKEYRPEFELWKLKQDSVQYSICMQYSFNSSFLIAYRISEKENLRESILIKEVDPSPIIYQLVFSKCRIDGGFLIIENDNSTISHVVDFDSRSVQVRGKNEYSDSFKIDQVLHYVDPSTSNQDRMRIMMNL